MSDNHGNTPAAWTAVVVGLLGFTVGGAGLMISPINYIVFWVGVGMVVVAGIIYLAMARLGYGDTAHHHS